VILPVGIDHIIRGWPRVTIALMVTCTLVQLYSHAFAPSFEELRGYAVDYAFDDAADGIPDLDTAVDEVVAAVERRANRIPAVRFGYHPDDPISYRLVTSAFVHDGWLHLIGNLIFLWLVGAALEDRWGRARFAAFYLAGAVASALAFGLLYRGPPAILVGASGAISALMGAFLVNFARMKIHFLYVLGFAIGRASVPAFVALPLWLGEQGFYAWLESSLGVTLGVAFTAHIAGFVFGVVGALVARTIAEHRDRPPPPPRAIATIHKARIDEPLAPPPPPPPTPPRASTAPPKPEPPPELGAGPRFLG
jgi:membrane associated rhomboid family serine protease